MCSSFKLNSEGEMFSAIILSGGKGKRMERERPKQYLLLCGKPIIMHSIERMECIKDIGEIIIVCENEYIPAIKKMLGEYNITTPVKFALAGATRQESVYSGLKEVSCENVIIHEAARPFVKCEDFRKLIDDPAKNATLGYPVSFTVAEGIEYVTGILNRNVLVNIQLPQKFQTDVLKKAHELARKEQRMFTEDSGMVFELTETNIKIIRGSSENVKITEPIDLICGEIIYAEYIKGRR